MVDILINEKNIQIDRALSNVAINQSIKIDSSLACKRQNNEIFHTACSEKCMIFSLDLTN